MLTLAHLDPAQQFLPIQYTDTSLSPDGRAPKSGEVSLARKQCIRDPAFCIMPLQL